jgi:glycogen debranching enzyme
MTDTSASAPHDTSQSDAQRKEATLTQSDPSKLGGTAGATILKQADLYLLTNDAGDVPWELPHACGLYTKDCRFLNGLLLRLNGSAPEVLSNSHVGDQHSIHHLTNPALHRSDGNGAVPPHTVSVLRSRTIRDGAVRESIRLRNHNLGPVRVEIDLRARCAFEDIFAVKGFLDAKRGPVDGPASSAGRELTWTYHGTDGVTRRTRLVFDPAPARLRDDCASYDLQLQPSGEISIAVVITPSVEGNRRPAATSPRPENEEARVQRAEQAWLRSSAEIVSSNEVLNSVLRRALLDLKVLRSRLGRRRYFAAGVPWFVTLFGRDSAIVALQTLPFRYDMARETLLLLAEYQAQSFDRYRDAEPGKILHELRRGEFAHNGTIPQSPAYYGTVDATMLFVILAAEYYAWSGDLATIRGLAPCIHAALDWMDASGDHDADGYFDYVGAYPNGLVNQGWKDSGNAIVNADGSLAEPPIALAEVQSYAYRAWRRAAFLLRALDDSSRADAADRSAAALQARFEQDFWWEEAGCYVLARQKGGRRADVIASNAGQVLWGGIATPDRAGRVAARLFEPDMFSGWGIRTLSSRERRFNPISYHLGSVWPHDNALILAGLRHYGLDDYALRIFKSLFDAAVHLPGYRLPELFCGYERQPGEPPVPYPFASAPQAWAAGAVPDCIWNLLGLRPDAPRSVLEIVRPVLPASVDWIDVHHLRVGDAEVRIRFERRGDGEIVAAASVTRGELQVRVTRDR